MTGGYWFNVRTRTVESDDERSRKDDLLGPYPSREAAEQALAGARARTEEWDEEDRRYRGDDED